MRFKSVVIFFLCAGLLCGTVTLLAQDKASSETNKVELTQTNNLSKVPDKKVEKEFLSEEDFGKWLMDVFMEKDMTRFSYALKFAGENKQFSSLKNVSTMMIFLGTILRTYPETVNVFFKTVDTFPSSEILFALLSVKYANVEKGNKSLDKYLEECESKEVVATFENIKNIT